MLPERGWTRWLSLIGYAVAIFGSISTAGAWAGSKLVFQTQFHAHERLVSEAVESLKSAVSCNDYHSRLGEIETRETFISQSQSLIEANRQAGVRLTPIEISRYNENALNLRRLDEARQKLEKPPGCQ